MALVPHSQVFSSFTAIKSGTLSSSTNPYPKFCKSRTLKISASSSSPNSEDDKSLETQETDPVKLAFAKAMAYKKASKVAAEQKQNGVLESKDNKSDDQGVPSADKFALESNTVQGSEKISGSNKGNVESGRNALPKKSASKKEELPFTAIDFVGLDFSDKKKSRGLPAGLVPIADPFAGGDLPDVEIIVGDTSKFVDSRSSKSKRIQEDDTNTYKPKVSTWGVFPRPKNISETFGGGRNIRPGEALESAEEKAAKEARTRELLSDYMRRKSPNIDPKLKRECEKVLKDGDSLMDLGQLREALPFYENVMNKLPFQTELHGVAALQWSICQDSLLRSSEARIMYEKLQSHPTAEVSRKARQFVFSFQAMEMMKVTGSNFKPPNTGYQSYFNAFVWDKVNYSPKEDEVEEGTIQQTIPYIIFLLSPIFIVLLIALRKGV